MNIGVAGRPLRVLQYSIARKSRSRRDLAATPDPAHVEELTRGPACDIVAGLLSPWSPSGNAETQITLLVPTR